MVHFKDGYVIHHKRGQRRDEETVVDSPLDVVAASKTSAYRISSSSDRAFANGLTPDKIGRKSKGTDFAWHVDQWVGDHAVNVRPDHTKEHWITLFLPERLREGKSYTVSTGSLAKNGQIWKVSFSALSSRSESVHVNSIGYVPSSPSKFGYVYDWIGDTGCMDLKPLLGRHFWLIDQKSGKNRFEGRVVFRKGQDNLETGSAHDTPLGNFEAADVAECDFSRFRLPGRYVLSVEGIGCSWPFTVGDDVYRAPFRTTARGLFLNRSGIRLGKPYANFDRPAPHRVGVTPKFKLMYSSLRYLDYGSESGTRSQIEPTIKGPLESWGWYQDAGDWDSYPTHLKVAQDLLLAFELNPTAFKDGELNLPESGNGVPDILDEAGWLPRFCFRLRHELISKKYGSGGLGLRIDGDPFGPDTKPNDVGQGSWEDVDRTWVASGEDPVSTYGYAGVAAQMAHCLEIARLKDPQGIDWLKEAKEAYGWAAAHTLEQDEVEVRPNRLYASASLFRETGEKAYEDRVRHDLPHGPYVGMDLYGPAIYAIHGLRADRRDKTLLTEVKNRLIEAANASHDSGVRRSLRWCGDWGLPMLIGQQTTPLVMDIAVAWRITGSSKFLADLYNTGDYFLGTNSLNTTWVTGLGPRCPNQVFHMDSWYTGNGTPHPGIVPYGPWRKEHETGQGPWDHDWVNKTVYPAIDLWPGAERWFDDRCTPLESEFTIHQNTAPAAAFFAVLCAPAVPHGGSK